jgi:hypothetical protein
MYTHLVAQVSLKVGHGNAPWKVMECSEDFCTAVTVLRLGPQRSGQPTWTLSTSSRSSSSCNSNTSSSSASQSALQAVAPDTPDRRTAQVLAAHWATRQERYNKSAFPAQLAKALRRHGMAVQAGRTSTHVIQGITNKLTHVSSHVTDIPHDVKLEGTSPTTVNWNTVRHDAKLCNTWLWC